MQNQKLIKLNEFINKSYECFSFSELLRLVIMKLHEYVLYDSGVFYCSISRDCSFFKPYLGGPIEEYYKKQDFAIKDDYNNDNCGDNHDGQEANVYKSVDYTRGIVQIANEPRNEFLEEQKDFHIVCIRIVYHGQFMGEIYLHRSKEKPDFNEEDLFTLRILQPHVSTVFHIIHTVTAVQYLENNQQLGPNLGVSVFDGDLSLIGGNITGVEMLKTVTVFGSSILYHIKEICEDMLNSKEEKHGNASYKTQIIKTNKSDMKLQIYLNHGSRSNNRLQYVVVMQYCDVSQLTADYKFKFTKREADIIDNLIQGKNNTQLAEALNISENTVKTHIKSIYKKTGANNRTELTYVLMLNNN